MVEEILERFSVGETITAVCSDTHMPTIRALQKWRIKDKELDDACFKAEMRGIMVHAAEAVDAQRSVIHGTFKGDAKRAQAIVTAANNMGHQALAKLSKLDNRYKDKQEIHHTGPMIIGWETQPNEARKEKVMTDSYLDAVTPEDVAN